MTNQQNNNNENQEKRNNNNGNQQQQQRRNYQSDKENYQTEFGKEMDSEKRNNQK